MRRVLADYSGRAIRMPDERWGHIIARHPEMASLEYTISESLLAPDKEFAGTGLNSWKYARWFKDSPAGDRWVIVVVRIDEDDAFILTAWTQNRL